LERAVWHSERLHQQLFVHLDLAYVQIDELKAPIVGDKENWLWAAIEPLTQIVPAIQGASAATTMRWCSSISWCSAWRLAACPPSRQTVFVSTSLC
jgi:hypothetical protein